MRFYGGKRTKNGFVGASANHKEINKFLDGMYTPKIGLVGLIFGVFLGAILYAETNMLYGAILGGVIGGVLGAAIVPILLFIVTIGLVCSIITLIAYLIGGP